jgi:hypothetical protein
LVDNPNWCSSTWKKNLSDISYPAADYRCNRKSQISASDRQEIPQFIALDEIGLAGQSVHEGRLNRQGKTGKRSHALI